MSGNFVCERQRIVYICKSSLKRSKFLKFKEISLKLRALVALDKPCFAIGGPKMSGNFVRERQRIVYICKFP